jgi:hypothetical protein
MNWKTGAKCNRKDLMYGLPSPWKEMPGVKVEESVGGKITASIPLSFIEARGLLGSCGVYSEDGGYRDLSIDEICDTTRLCIGAVDVFTREWIMSIGPNGERDNSTPIVSIKAFG